MPVVDVYHKRMKALQDAGNPKLYSYDVLPNAFRGQIIHIWRSCIGESGTTLLSSERPPYQWWKSLHDALAREMGVTDLAPAGLEGPFGQCVGFLKDSPADQCLSMIELSFGAIQNASISSLLRFGISQSPDDGIDELNERFKEHGLGYRFRDGRIFRVDSDYVHTEAVEPALTLLDAEGFAGPTEEFISAHKHYREGNLKEAISKALNAFESTMKAICDARGWTFDPSASAKKLIAVVLANGLVDKQLESHLTGLRTTLESGLPTIRNKQGGHGQGSNVVDVPDYIAAYALHLAASNIVLLVSAHRDLP